MEPSDKKATDTTSSPAVAPLPAVAALPAPAPTPAPPQEAAVAPAPAPHTSTAEPSSPLPPQAGLETDSKLEPEAETKTESTSEPKLEPTSEPKTESKTEPAASDKAATPTIIPAPPVDSEPVIQKEQEEFEGTVDVNDDIPTEKDLQKVGDLLVLDAKGASRPFKELYKAPSVAPRQLIIFIRHFFCGNCQEYIRTLSSSIKPDDLLALPMPTFITVIGCGRPELIPMYIETTSCPFPVYADPTRKLYDLLGMTRTFNLGSKPDYMHTNVLINSVQSIFQGLGSGKHALKGGDFKQVGGEFLFEDGECSWVHRMKTTRDHAEVTAIRSLLGLDGTRPPLRKKWSHGIKEQEKDKRRSLSWGKLKSKGKGNKDLDQSGTTTPERVDEEADKKLVGRPTV